MEAERQNEGRHGMDPIAMHRHVVTLGIGYFGFSIVASQSV